MSKHVMPFIVVNYGCEMMFVLAARLAAQLVEPTKASRIKSDIVSSMFSASFMDELFRPQEVYTYGALRRVFTTVADSSIMKLSENSMKKLFELMSMTVKYQTLSLHHPYELLDYTINHLDELKRDTPADVHPRIDDVAGRMCRLSASLNLGEMAEVRSSILTLLLDRRIKVSLFLERHTQFADGNFKLPPAQYLPPIAATHAPGTIYFHVSGGKQVDTTSFPHRDAAMGHPPNLTVGQWGPQHFTSSAPRMTTSGENLYRGNKTKDVLATHAREMPSTPPPAAPMAPLPTPSDQLQAYQNEMNYLSQLAGKRAQPQEKIALSLFEDDTDDGTPAGLTATATAPVATAPAAQQQPPMPSSPAATTSPASSMVKVYKMDAGAVREENKQLLGIISGLGGGKPPGATQSGGNGDDNNLLDIMDDI